MTNEKRNKMQGKESDKKDLKLSALLALCILFALMAAGLMGCNKETPNIVHKPVLSLSIDVLLPTDSNGYSYYELYNPNGQNIHTITGTFLIDGKPPVGEPVIANWESSHSWILQKGKLVYTLTKSYINPLTGLWTVTVLPSVISQIDYIVPTINKSCYVSSETGEIFSVIAPIGRMKGDTITIKAYVLYMYPTKIVKEGAHGPTFESEFKTDSIFTFKKIILK
jgi:hypothetical protein